MRKIFASLVVTAMLAGCAGNMPGWLAPDPDAPETERRPITLDEAMIYARALGITPPDVDTFDRLNEDQRIALCYFAVHRLDTRLNAASEAVCADILPGLESPDDAREALAAEVGAASFVEMSNAQRAAVAEVCFPAQFDPASEFHETCEAARLMSPIPEPRPVDTI